VLTRRSYHQHIMDSTQIKTAAFAFLNIASVCAIVVVNKLVFKTFEFHFPTTLVGIHSFITWAGLSTAAAIGYFERKHLPARSLQIMAVSFIAYNVASLANLNVNPVGFYQISKILITPTLMATEFLCFGKTTSNEVKAAVALMCVGVTMATVNDVGVAPFGLFIGICAIFGAVQQQILIGKMQKDLGASANQLLVAYTPYAYTMLFLISPIDLFLPDNSNYAGFGAYNEWIEKKMSALSVATILISGCLGLLVSLSTFLLIAHTSPLTYNIVGHLKTCSILLSGWLLFEEPMSSGKFFGIMVALTGVIWYSKIKMTAQRAVKLQASASQKV